MIHRHAMPGIVVSFMLASVAVAEPLGGQSTVDALVARHIAALGGAERLGAVNSVRMTGTATAGSGRWAHVTRVVQRPHRIRTEFTIQGITSVYAFDGERGWYVAPLEGVLGPAPMSPEASLAAAEQAGIGGPLVHAVDNNHGIDLAGREPMDGRDVYRITVTPPAGPARTLYLDAASALLVRTTSARLRPDGTRVQLESDLGNYRETGGIMFPHSIRSRALGQPDVLEIEVSEVELDPPVDPAEFAPPGD